ncbi:MAG: alkaline shock response membrane anchor protein AmaP [Candidatus Omnitrophica bacterium]|jgi:uncharacterized alkaline shock family protein YloU|nr:alkaline shock response membrane anchor protein AmaP [Candidatus Omnitrophota bacterium]
MRILSTIGIIFYAVVLIFIGLALIIFSLNVFLPQDINGIFTSLQENVNSRVIIGTAGVVLIVVSFSLAQLILGRYQREKTIAFDTASGEVTVALGAVEDLIKRLVVFLPEIKELRPDVVASKKGISVDLRVVLKSETNIPDMTMRLQEITKSKIQEVLGLDEPVTIRIHIAKISSIEDKDKDRRKHDAQQMPSIPFSGYNRV